MFFFRNHFSLYVGVRFAGETNSSALRHNNPQKFTISFRKVTNPKGTSLLFLTLEIKENQSWCKYFSPTHFTIYVFVEKFSTFMMLKVAKISRLFVCECVFPPIVIIIFAKEKLTPLIALIIMESIFPLKFSISITHSSEKKFYWNVLHSCVCWEQEYYTFFPTGIRHKSMKERKKWYEIVWVWVKKEWKKVRDEIKKKPCERRHEKVV